MKKFLLVILVLSMCFSICACGSSSSTTSKSNKLEYSSDAIYAVKNDRNTELKICRGLGFKHHYKADYGTCKAIKKSGGEWEVTLHGNMFGYYDDEKTDLDNLGFVMTATVSEDGEVLSSSVKKVN